MKPLVIAATGACTPIGTRAWQVGSSFAARQSGFTRQAITGQAEHRATVSRVQAIDPACKGTERLIRLAAPALQEALRAPPAPTAGWPLQRPIALFLALPEPLPELPDWIDTGRIALELPRALDLAPEFLPIHLSIGGTVAGAQALAHAYRFLHDTPHAAEAIIGGVDSFVDTEIVDALHQRRWARVNGVREGFIASEGAAFVRLCRQPGAEDYATVNPPYFAQEAHSRMDSSHLPEGRALIEASQGALQAANLPASALHSHWCDMDGSAWRGAELASLGAALAPQGGLPPAQEPAALLGEMGAAWVPLLLSLFHEMRQIRDHPVLPSPLAGHASLFTVAGLDHRVAAWSAAWHRQAGAAAPPAAPRRQSSAPPQPGARP